MRILKKWQCQTLHLFIFEFRRNVERFCKIVSTCIVSSCHGSIKKRQLLRLVFAFSLYSKSLQSAEKYPKNIPHYSKSTLLCKYIYRNSNDFRQKTCTTQGLGILRKLHQSKFHTVQGLAVCIHVLWKISYLYHAVLYLLITYLLTCNTEGIIYLGT